MAPPVTVGRLLMRAFAALVMLIVLSGSSGVAAVVLQHRAVEQLTEHVLPLQLVNAELRAVLADAQRGLRGYLLAGDAALLGNYEAARSRYPGVVAAMRRITNGSENELTDAQVVPADAWWALAERQRRSPPRSPTAVRYVAQGRPLFQAFLTANEALDTDLNGRAAALRAQSKRLGIATTVALAGLTACAALLAAWTAVRTTRRIVGPVHRVVTVLDRLGQGRADSRADTEAGPAEMRAVAAAVNSLADENQRARGREREEERLHQQVRGLGVAIRHHLSVDSAVREAARGLGETLRADHVLIRLDDGPPVGWSAEQAPGSLDELARCSADWLGDDERFVGTGRDVAATDADPLEADYRPSAGPPPPEYELQAWRAAGAGPVAVVAVHSGDTRIGVITLTRAAGGPGWTDLEVRLAEAVAAELGRGVNQARLYEREQQLVARLQELDTAKNDFMSTVSHELRTPLTSINGYLEMLADGDAGAVNAAQARMLDVIARNTARLRSLIEDLLILSRIEAGTFHAERADVQVRALVEAAVAAIKPAAAQAAVSVHADVRGRPTVYADADQLDRVLMNLLSNAVKFSPPEGTVTVTVSSEQDEVVIRVADTGMGIPKAEQQHLFTRFFRASNAVHQAIPGTGLGLTIVQTIVANHGGRVELTSDEGSGTTITVRLPVAVSAS